MGSETMGCMFLHKMVLYCATWILGVCRTQGWPVRNGVVLGGRAHDPHPVHPERLHTNLSSRLDFSAELVWLSG